MKRTLVSAFMAVVIAILAIAPAFAATGAGQSAAPNDPDNGVQAVPAPKGGGDDLDHPLGNEQRALREQALEDKLRGKPVGKVHEVAKGQYVELAREGEDLIWTVLGEFGNQINSNYGGTPGPLHNQIPQPDRSVNNTDIWTADFNRPYYESLFNAEGPGTNSMRQYYIEQSSNRYAVRSEVSDWVLVPFNEANYGSNYCGSIVCARTWLFVRDSINAWYNGQIAAGKTSAEVNAYLAQFDVWDRYDYNGNGNFDEPDGYIDHFQSVHAGVGEESGGGAQGTDAIWSHRWYAFYNLIGFAGPAFNPAGGLRVGNSDFWVGDYTIEPENGGVGVFVHEFGHDLGLPDLYDTAGNTCGSACENSTGFWTLMSAGSNTGYPDTIVSVPTHLGVWEKLQLGWLNYEVAFAGQKSEHKLGPAETNTKQAQGLFIVLPDKEVSVNLGAPYAGMYYYYSGAGDSLDNFMVKQVTLPAGATLTAQVRYQIEVDWDYAYVAVSTDGGNTWTGVPTNLSTNTNPNGQNFGNGITGSSGGNWVALSADLSAYSGNVLLGFRYWTDGAVVEPGFMVDEISIAGGPADGAESDAGWTFQGFRVTTGTESQAYFNAYVAEFRQYRGYDESLRSGAYNFGFLNTLPDWVERFPYQDGLLISYWDSSQTDNSTSAHPGTGLILPIDAHPATMFNAGGTPWRARIQSYDSTFGLEPTDAITLHSQGVPSYHPSLPAVPVFDDRIQYYNPQTATAGVVNPNTGTQVRVKSVSAQGGFMQVEVRPAN